VSRILQYPRHLSAFDQFRIWQENSESYLTLRTTASHPDTSFTQAHNSGRGRVGGSTEAIT